ncbi:growth-blocking peptide, long form-like [Pectinophora gossypiella]|uniref:Uncharacterized protein n=1 Tax=Pectinophora gossypiella TaxID=13191 RepID=A0A1E1W268_PECGO|nr:growth-blocking peptide, long form-like [Pectinophora gossypiella]
MKYSFFVLIFAITVINYETVNCGIVKNFFDDVHNTAHKVREDIKDLLHPKKGEDTPTKAQEEVSVKEPTVKPAEQPSKSEEKPVEVTTTSTPKAASDSTVATTAAPASNVTTTEKDGRENFKGSCATGYARTADGRCKPTF